MFKSILLTLGLCATLIMVLSALASPESTEVESSIRPALPSEIADAEAEYELEQQAIEREIQRLTFGTLALSPEERRATMIAGMEALRPFLLEQQASSDAIDALYVKHQIPNEPGRMQVLAAQAPKDAQAESSAEGRRWALDYDLARLRQEFADDPEGLRVAMMQWNADNADPLRDILEVDVVAPDPPDQRLAEQPLIVPMETPAGATETVRELVSLLNELAADTGEYPSTMLEEASSSPSEAAQNASAAIMQRILTILQEFDEENNRRLIQQYAHEIPN